MLTPRLRVLALAQERQAQPQASHASPLAPRERRRERPSNASDAGSHSSSRASSRHNPYARPPAPAARKPTTTVNDYLAEAFARDQAKQETAKPQKKRRQKAPAAASTASTGPPPVHRDTSAARSDASMNSTVHTPMSITGDGPARGSEEQSVRLPGSRSASASAPAAADSSDEDGAHQPRERAQQERRPEAPPLPAPAMGLVQATAGLSAALPSDDAANQPPRATRVSDDDRRAMHDARARQAAEAAAAQAAMESSVADMLVNPATSVYDVLMVEYALQPDAPREAGAMRADYLKQLAGARQKPHVPRQTGVAHLATMRAALERSPALRETAVQMLNLRKAQYAESQCGHGPLQTIRARSDETLMALMARTHEALLPKRGRPAAQKGALSVRPSRAGGQVRLEWREREHSLRVYAANKPISYRAIEAVASAGAMLHVEGLEEANLSKVTSRSAASMHDEQNHLIQRRCAVDVLGRSPKCLLWDEGSKRKKAWVVSSIVGGRENGDGSRLREVMAAKALLPDAADGGKKKSGKNVAKGVFTSTVEFFYPDGRPTDASQSDYIELTTIHFMQSDFTASNSGKVKGSATIIRINIYRLSGHFLIFNAPCGCHVGHNETAIVLRSFGICERTPIARKKKKRDDDGILSALPELVPALLDDMVEVAVNTPGLMEYLAQEEGVTQLRMPATGVATRWGYYDDAAEFFQPLQNGGRLDRFINFLISNSPTREYDGESVDKVTDLINNIQSEDVRELLHELAKPHIRAKLMVFELYGTGGETACEYTNEEEEANEAGSQDEADEASSQDEVELSDMKRHSNRNYIHFTENDDEGIVFKFHRVVRRRRDHLQELARADIDDERLQALSEYVDAHADAFAETDVEGMVREAFGGAYEYFHSHTEYLFKNPVYLAFGMMDEGGDGVRSAKELVDLTGGQEPMKVFPGLIAAFFNSDKHTNFTATQIEKAIEESADSPTHVFLPELWELVKSYAKMPPGTLLKDQESLKALNDHLFRFGRHLPISNFFSETVIKTLLKTLHPTQRRREATASRWLAALHRDPARLFRLTQALVQWARRALGHSKQLRLIPRAAVAEVEQHGSILGLGAGFDVPLFEHADEQPDLAEGADGEAQEAEDDGSCETGDFYFEDAEEGDESDVVGELMAELSAKGDVTLEYVKQTAESKRSGLQVGTMITLGWSAGGVEGQFFLAEVLSLPKTAKAWTFNVRWYDEVQPNVYEPDARWKPGSARLMDIISLSPPLTKLGSEKWSINTAPSQPAVNPLPRKQITSMLAKPSAAKPSAAKPSAAKPADKPSAAKPSAAKPADKAKPQPPPAKPQPTAEGWLANVEAVLEGAGRLRSDRPILSRRDSEWCNDCQIHNDSDIVPRPAGAPPVQFFYPRDEDGAAKVLKEAPTMRRLVAGQLEEGSSIVLPFSRNQLHWHVLFGSASDKVVYHFEGFGGDLRSSPVNLAFDDSLGRLGWRLVSVRLHLQSDSSSCGIWIQVARDWWLEYVASTEHGNSAFESFMQEKLKGEGVQSESGLRGTALSKARKANEQYILTARADMRGRLVQAALEGKLSVGQANLPGFAKSAPVDLTQLDDIIL